MHPSTLSGAFVTNAFCLKTIIAPLFCDMFSQLSWVLSPVFNFFFARDPKREKKAHSDQNWPLLRVQQPFKICIVSFPVTCYNDASRHIQYCMPLALKMPTVKCEQITWFTMQLVFFLTWQFLYPSGRINNGSQVDSCELCRVMAFSIHSKKNTMMCLSGLWSDHLFCVFTYHECLQSLTLEA